MATTGSIQTRQTFINGRGWLSFGFIGGILAFVALTGVLITLSPFGALVQAWVLLHTAVGVLAVPALAVWQYRHWATGRTAPRRPRKISAYIGFWLLAASIAAGFVITFQAIFALHITRAWAQLHLWTGVLALPFLVHHLIPSRAAESLPARRRMWKSAAWLSASLLAASGAIAAALRMPPNSVSASSSGNIFSPSNAGTENGRPLTVAALANSESCGVAGCHTAIYEEWRASAHRWSSEDQFFQTVRGVMTELHGRTVTEKCAGCHEPVSLMSGHKDPTLGASAPGYHEGDSCVVCHAVRKVDERGIGSYVLGAPEPYLYEASTAPVARAINHFLIRAYPAQHSRDYNLTPVRRADSCAPCHKEYDVIVEQQGPVQVETQYDDWKQGKWNTDRDTTKRLYCQQCHMYYLESPLADPYDLKAGLGRKHRNHYFAAGNQFMPEALAAPDAAGQVQRVTEWLHGKRPVPEIAKVWPEGPPVALKIAAPPAARPGAPMHFQVTLANEKVGHSFPTGPLNIVRAWVEVTVTDAAGREIFHSGKLDAAHHIENGSYVLKPLAIDLHGNMIMEPDLWHPEGPKYVPAILAGKTATYDYEFTLPRNAPGPLTIATRLRYRKANQFFMDSVYPNAGRTTPVTDVSTAAIQLPLGATN